MHNSSASFSFYANASFWYFAYYFSKACGRELA